ncbi:hypothetical protein [Bacilliculturomica massiliensis]|uniref:hypothetical protein n=1 Tax=Bacilliculturomica massiliensis TaxID=1917867 RepID=UPI001030D4FC|nr:hypothetical protein [Bacilliculturomica massiliensis]
MENTNLVLGLDTSNYTTSAAVTDAEGNIIRDLRRPLRVKQGERGLRQSDALFQHMENLPELLAEILDSPLREGIKAVCASEKPRPVEGSYMPVFLAGLRFGTVVAKSLQAPFFLFSHQEGHLAAAVHGTDLTGVSEYLAWHLSGGTCELLSVAEGGRRISIIGGSKDISFGQLIDRVGVSMGMAFPCGRAMDEEAMSGEGGNGETCAPPVERTSVKNNPLKPIPTDGLYFNVSGMETQAQRLFSRQGGEGLSRFLFQRIVQCLAEVTVKAAEHAKKQGEERAEGPRRVLFTGGVAASAFLRENLRHALSGTGAVPVFGAPALSSDNAVGISLLGGQALWR